MIKCITFDITNTLIRVASGANVALHYSNIIQNNFDPKFSINIELANKNFRKYFKLENELNPGYGFSKGMESRDWWSNVVVKVIQEDLKSKNKANLFDKKQLEDMAGVIYDEFKQAKYWDKYKNCDLVLEELKKSFKLGVISNFDERLFEIMKNLNLNKYFDFVCIPSNSQGFSKPYNKIFMNALLRSGYQNPKELIHVGDSFDLDYLPAIGFNLNSLLLKHCSSDAHKKETLKILPDIILKNNHYAFDLDELLIKLKKI